MMTLWLIITLIFISVIATYLGLTFSKKFSKDESSRVTLKDGLKYLLEGKVELWEQFKLLKKDWNNTIENFSFDGHNLAGSNFKGLKLKGVSFKKCNLDGADFSSCLIENVSFENASIGNSSFRYTSLLEVNFNGSKLKYSSFAESKIEKTLFRSTDLSFANFDDSTFMDIKGSYNEKVLLAEGIFENAVLDNLSLQGAEFIINENAEISFELNENVGKPQGVSNKLLELKQRVLSLHEVPSHKLEEIIIELFSRQGYLVTQSNETKDQGYDIEIHKESRFGELSYLVEIKSYASNQKVGIDLIHMAEAISIIQKFNGFIIISITGFTTEAISYSSGNPKLVLVDKERIFSWIDELDNLADLN